MSVEQQFRVNEYITLKLERLNDRLETVIYAGGERFRQCKYLLLKISMKRIRRLDEIESIDEAAEKLDHSQEPGELFEPKIPPETEFWGHCSNLQVWAEHHYDTRLIHSNLAFPLLKRLTELGDPQAKRAFKEEIAKRLASGHRSTVLYLHKEGYLDYLSQEERITAVRNMPQEKFEKFWNDQELYFLDHEGRLRVLLEDREAEAIINIEKIVQREFKIATNNKEADFYNDLYILAENKHVVELFLTNSKINEFPQSICVLKKLRKLNLSENSIPIIPDFVSEFTDLEEFTVNHNTIDLIPRWIKNLDKLKRIGIAGNRIRKIPIEILTLNNLEELDLFLEDEKILDEKSKNILEKIQEKGTVLGP